MKYLLGQIYAEQDQNGLAYQMFGQVIKANPPYELEFAARIRQTEVFTGGNYQKVIKMLQRNGESDKNKDLLDQVYYALGNVYMSREDTVNAIKTTSWVWRKAHRTVWTRRSARSNWVILFPEARLCQGTTEFQRCIVRHPERI